MDTLAQQSGNGAKRTKVNPSKTGQTTSRQKVLMKRLMDDRGTTVDKNYVSKMLSGSYYHIIGPFNDGSYQIYDRRTSTPTNINATYEIPNLDLNEQDGLLPIIKELIESGAIK